MAGRGCWRCMANLLATRGHGQRRWNRWRGEFAARFHAFLPKLTYPIRVGTHYNIAFALILADAWAQDHDEALARLIAGARAGLVRQRPRLSGVGTRR